MSAAVAAPALVPRASGRVVVVGGGLAGLVAAYELEKRGVTVQLLEASDGFGGRMATAEYEGGATAEYGTQELWGDNPLIGTARELGVTLDNSPEKAYSSAVIDGKLYPYYRDTKDQYFDSLMSPPEKRRFEDWLDEAQQLRQLAESEGLKSPRVQALQPISFGSWVQSANLPRTAAELVRLLIECEVATSWQNFSALFGLLELGEFLGEGQLSYHVSGGNSRLVERLVKAIRGEKLTQAPVVRIERVAGPGKSGPQGIRVFYQRQRRVQMVEAERVVLAVPFWRLHQIEMVPPLAAEKWQAVSSLVRGQYTVVHLMMPREARPLWMIDGKYPLALLTDGPLGVVYGTPAESTSDAPVRPFSLLVHGQAAAAFHMVPRELRLREIYTHLDRLWPGLSSQVQASYVYTYHPGAVAVWPPGRSPLDELSQKLREPELGLYLAGDYLYNAHSDGAARSGIQAAERIAADLALSRPTVAPLRAPPAPRPARRRGL